jgi:hypothetical protein
MLETLPQVMDFNSRLTTISPNHPSCFTEVLLIISKDDEIVK